MSNKKRNVFSLMCRKKAAADKYTRVQNVNGTGVYVFLVVKCCVFEKYLSCKFVSKLTAHKPIHVEKLIKPESDRRVFALRSLLFSQQNLICRWLMRWFETIIGWSERESKCSSKKSISLEKKICWAFKLPRTVFAMFLCWIKCLEVVLRSFLIITKSVLQPD